MLTVIAWEDDPVGKLAYEATMHLSVIAPGMTGPKQRARQRKFADYASQIAACRTLLASGVPAPAHSIAFFSSPAGRFRDRCICLNPSHFDELGIIVPECAETARYKVAVRGAPLWKDADKFKNGLPEAVRSAVVLLNRSERRRLRSPLGFISYEAAGILA